VVCVSAVARAVEHASVRWHGGARISTMTRMQKDNDVQLIGSSKNDDGTPTTKNTAILIQQQLQQLQQQGRE